MLGTWSLAGTWRRAAALALAFAALTAAARDARAEPYKDEKLGYSFTYPKKWKVLPLAPDEKTVVARFQCDREYEYNDPKTNSYDLHRPLLEVVVLPIVKPGKDGGAKVEQTDEGVAVTVKKRWKDLEEYLDAAVQGKGWGGYFFSKKEETKSGALKAMVYEITVEKLADGPKRVYGWAVYAEDAIYGMIGDSLISQEGKVKPDYEAAFRSFKVFPRTGALPGAVTTGEPDVVVKDPTKKLDPAAKAKKREEDFSAYVARLKEGLPKDWKVKDTEHFVVVTHTDDKTTKELLDHAEALRAWLDENLAYLGPLEPGRAVLRVCANPEEYRSMMGSGGAASWRYEITTYKDMGDPDARLYELNSDLWRIWRDLKNSELRGRMPNWLDVGLRFCLTTARSKGRKVEFKAAAFDNETIATLRRGDKLLTGRDFVNKGTEELWQAERASLQSEYFTRFLLTGSAQKNPKYKGLLAQYLSNLVAAIDEEAKKEKEKQPAEEAAKEPQNEEEENALFKARQNRWKELEKQVLSDLLAKTFPGWEDKDWDAFDRAYWKELGV